MARLCGVLRSSIGLLSGKSFAHKMKTRVALALAAGMALAVLTIFLLNASLNYRYCPVPWNDAQLTTTRDAFNALLRNILYNSGGNASLLVGELSSVQNKDSVLRGLLAASHSALPSPRLQGASYSSFSTFEEFPKAVGAKEKQVFVDLLRVIDDVTARHNITYFMTFGTMLGSFRHHDMTPWDDDADVAMPYSQKGIVWTLLSNLEGLGYVVNVTADTQFRFVGRKSRLYSPSWEWRWPYVDIDFYSENDTHIWVYSAGRVLRYDKATVFPVHRRPLGPVSLNAPRDGLTYLRLTYDDYAACSTGMQHRVGRNRPSVTIPCSVFNETYPFVHRSLTWDEKVMETLKLGSKVLYSVTVDEPTESASINPFTLESV